MDDPMKYIMSRPVLALAFTAKYIGLALGACLYFTALIIAVVVNLVMNLVILPYNLVYYAVTRRAPWRSTSQPSS